MKDMFFNFFKIKNTHSIKYYDERMGLLIIALIIFSFLYFITLAILFNLNIIELIDLNLQEELRILQETKLYWVIGFMVLFLIIILVLNTFMKSFKVGSFIDYRCTPKKALIILTLSTILLILFISMPILITGGSINSIYGNQLITLCTVAILVTKSNSLRLIIISISLIIYYIGINHHFNYVIKDQYWYGLLYFFMIVANVGFTGWIGWKRLGILDEEN